VLTICVIVKVNITGGKESVYIKGYQGSNQGISRPCGGFFVYRFSMRIMNFLAGICRKK
jgi:hypothetical protein